MIYPDLLQYFNLNGRRMNWCQLANYFSHLKELQRSNAHHARHRTRPRTKQRKSKNVKLK